MDADNWIKVKEILDKVLDVEPAGRSALLSSLGISVEMRAEVESLISFETEAAEMMQLSAVEFSKEFMNDDGDLTGQIIGQYRILRELGHGGMGAVYLAERADGKFEQKVALKLLKREMNTSALRRRFQQERKILSKLEHPNIARLLDAGTTVDKIPYLAMEYVDGLPIDDYCDKHGSDLNQRLDLFREVCAAVDFAHRTLVVHRDLKPSNIIVTDEGIPKLLDFGISKILSAEIIDTSTVTKLGVMTPSYASPEQLRNESVTTATDVYSLGVILYELLTGHRPFEGKESNLKDIYHAVIDADPPLPSSWITGQRIQAGEARSALISGSESKTQQLVGSKTRDLKVRTKPQSVIRGPQLKGDLDNIVLKAMQKEPERRYSSPENLAEDIKRHLRGLPVTARRDTFSYRAEKFIRRNSIAAIAGGLILLAIIVGVAATVWQARVAQAERAKAEKRFGDVRKLANSYLFDIFPEIENLEGSLKARQKIVSTALEYLDNLSHESEGDADLQSELATAYEKIGEVQGAVNITNLGDIQAGLASYKKAQTLRESVFAADPADARNKEALSKNYQITAQTLQWNIDTALASEFFEKAIKLRRDLVREKPESPDFQNRLAVMLTDYAGIAIENVDNEKAATLLDEATRILKETLQKSPEHFPTRKAYPRLLRARSILKRNTGDYNGAFADIAESEFLTAALIKEKPDDNSLNRTSWMNDMKKCDIYVEMLDGRKIVESCQKTLGFNIEALEKEPGESFALFDLAFSHYAIAQGYLLLHQPQKTIEFGGKALEPLAKLNEMSPGINEYMRSVAVVEKEMADAYLMLGKTDEALKLLQDARENMEKVSETDNTVTAYKVDLAKIYRSLAVAQNKNSETLKSLENIDRSIALISQINKMNALPASDRNLLSDIETDKVKFINPG